MIHFKPGGEGEVEGCKTHLTSSFYVLQRVINEYTFLWLARIFWSSRQKIAGSSLKSLTSPETIMLSIRLNNSHLCLTNGNFSVDQLVRPFRRYPAFFSMWSISTVSGITLWWIHPVLHRRRGRDARIVRTRWEVCYGFGKGVAFIPIENPGGKIDFG